MNNEKNVLLLSIEESKANLKKRKLWREYKKAKEKARELNNQLSDAWKEKVALKEKIDAAVDKMKVSPEHTNVWRSFHDFKEMKSKEIAGIIAKANHEHGLMLEEFDLAKNEETGSGAAFAHRRKAYHHQRLRNQANEQVKKLIAEISEAHDDADTKAALSNEYLIAKKAYNEAVEKHNELLQEYKASRAERDKKHKLFIEAQKNQELIKNKLQEEVGNSRLCIKFNYK